jgi:hypothetical protein
MAFKSVGVTGGTIWNLDAPFGSVGMHGHPQFAGVTWTSPTTGLASVSGGLWKMRKALDRTVEWRLSLNGSILTEGILTDAEPYTSANPLGLANGTGGTAALTFAVIAGDVVGLDVGRSVLPFDGDFVGLNLSISVIPEPCSLIMAIVGSIGLLYSRWRAARPN